MESLEELNALLKKQCENYGKHRIANRPDTVEAMFATEQPLLTPLPKFPLDVAKHINARVDAISTVSFQGSKYSVPVTYAGRQVGIKAYPETVEVYYQGDIIAIHARLFCSHVNSLTLSHYLPLLEERWRAVLDAAPVKQNLSEDAYEALKANYGNLEKMREILYRAAGIPLASKGDRGAQQQAELGISDPVTVKTVDIREYDNLASGW